MAIKPSTNINLKLMIPIIILSFWTGTTYMMVIKVTERQAITEAKMSRNDEMQNERDRAINDKLGDIKSELAVMNGNTELLIRRQEKARKY